MVTLPRTIPVTFYLPIAEALGMQHTEAERFLSSIEAVLTQVESREERIQYIAHALGQVAEDRERTVLSNSVAMIEAVKRLRVTDRENCILLLRAINDIGDSIYEMLREPVDCPSCGGSGGGDGPWMCTLCMGSGVVPAPDDF